MEAVREFEITRFSCDELISHVAAFDIAAFRSGLRAMVNEFIDHGRISTSQSSLS
jgi:hypothetical protein